MVRTVRCILVTALLMGGTILQAAATDPPPARSRAAEPSYTRERVFSIPFYINSQAKAPEQIVLYASGDQGRKWKAYQSRRASENRFDFRTASDGEFWFVVRSSQDPRLPNETTAPEKIVVIDQTPPLLTLKVNREAAGAFQAEWEVTDENLDPATFAVHYRMPGEEDWQPVTIDRPSKSDFVGNHWNGTVSWVTRSTDEAVFVKAEITDKAGNRRDWEQPVGVNANGPDSPTSPLAPITSTHSLEGTKTPSEFNWRDDNDTSSTRTVASSSSQFQTSSMRSSSTELSDLGGPSAPGGSPLGVEPATVPASRNIQLTNSKTVALEYDVEAQGNVGVDRVELWITSDDGLTWRAYDTDKDLKSPMTVELPGEGNYGFRLLIHDDRGHSAPAPKAGDLADLWIGFDNTPPQIRLTAAEARETEEGTELLLTWAASDAHLGDTPIRVAYCTRKTGPWATLLEGLPNTGRYQGTLKLALNPNSFIRIEAVDEAGNRASDETTEPVRTGGQPQGVIRGFRPASRSTGNRTKR